MTGPSAHCPPDADHRFSAFSHLLLTINKVISKQMLAQGLQSEPENATIELGAGKWVFQTLKVCVLSPAAHFALFLSLRSLPKQHRTIFQLDNRLSTSSRITLVPYLPWMRTLALHSNTFMLGHSNRRRPVSSSSRFDGEFSNGFALHRAASTVAVRRKLSARKSPREYQQALENLAALQRVPSYSDQNSTPTEAANVQARLQFLFATETLENHLSFDAIRRPIPGMANLGIGTGPLPGLKVPGNDDLQCINTP